MREQKKPNWLDWLAQVFKVTGVLTILSFAVVWGGCKLLSFSSAPAPKPPGTYATVDSPEETTEEATSDEDCTSVIAGSKTNNLIEATPELPTLPAAESDAEYEIRKRAVISRMTEILKILRRRPHAW